jgi:cell division septal protein FtsQ
MAFRNRAKRRRITGFLPQAGRALWGLVRWLVRHPQPLLLLGIASALGWSVWRFGRDAEVFRITQVILPPQSTLKVRGSLIGTNIWDLDIRSLAAELKQQEPSLKEVRVVRRLPNAVRIDPISRLPVAQLKLDRWHAVDRDGFILPGGRAEPDERLVRLSGFYQAGIPLRAGRENSEDRLAMALRVLGALRKSPSLVSRRLVEINVADPQQIRFSLEGETEVRCGSETELEAHLARLRSALKVIGRRSLDARYIDVRFQEPVIAPRT